MYENRLTERLIKYWNIIKKTDNIPQFSHFNSSAIDDIWQQCMLFSVLPAAPGKTPNLSFQRIGDKLKDIYSNDMLGRVFNPNARQFQGAAIMRKLDEIIANPMPLTDSGQFVSEKNKVVKYRSCLLPFGKPDHITHVIVGLSWKEF